jgi:uncharacterized membrane protein
MLLAYLYIIIVAATPILELRAAVPLALTVYGFSVPLALTLAVIGNMIPPLLLIPFLGKADKLLSQYSSFWREHFGKLLNKTRDNHEKKILLFKEFALITLVAIPFPLTGAWTASLVAYIFGIPFRQAIPLILAGVIIAGVLMTLITLGTLTFFA